jgi:hypothetical protein
VNGDGRPDLILAYIADAVPSKITFNVRLYLNNGSGFTDKGNIYSYPLAASVQPGVPWDSTAALDLLLGDYDSDGHADVAVRFLSYNETMATRMVISSSSMETAPATSRQSPCTHIAQPSSSYPRRT